MTYSSDPTPSSSNITPFDDSKLNTPFDIPTDVTQFEGYVHLQPITGRKFQLSVKNVTNAAGVTSEVYVWSAVSDVKNRTWVGSEDPKQRPNLLNKPKKGDIWWDDHQMELRVLHQPVLGVRAEGGDKEEILGNADWVSSTHPMANSIDQEGSDKNHMFGNVFVTGESLGAILTGEAMKFEVQMPFYTGDDGPWTENMGVDPIPYAEKRYTFDWSVNPQYNANVDGLTDAEKLALENKIDIIDADNPQRVEVIAGALGGNPNGAIKVQCTVTAKENVNHKFIVMGLGPDDQPVLHSSLGESSSLIILDRGSLDVVVPILPATTTYEYLQLISNNSEPLHGSVNTTDPVDMMLFPSKVTGPNAEGVADTVTYFDKQTDIGEVYAPLSTLNGIEQIPHAFITYENLVFEKVHFYFDYGVKGETYNLNRIPEFDISKFDDSKYTSLKSEELAEKYNIVFYEDGYVQGGSPPDENNLYQTPYTYETTEEIVESDQIIDGDNQVHVFRKVCVYYNYTQTPPRLYYAVKDESGTIIPGLHGVMTKQTPTRSMPNE